MLGRAVTRIIAKNAQIRRFATQARSEEPKPKGFAKMKQEDPQRLHEIQSKGGHHSHSHSGAKAEEGSTEHPLRGFAKMKEEDPERLHEIQSKGGHHSHRGAASAPESTESSESHLRGFAKMKQEDPERLHEIASKGGHRSHRGSSASATSTPRKRGVHGHHAGMSKGRKKDVPRYSTFEREKAKELLMREKLAKFVQYVLTQSLTDFQERKEAT